MGLALRARSRTCAAAASVLAILVAGPVGAQVLNQGDICDPATKELDRERLAMLALANAGVSPYPYRWVEREGAAPRDTRGVAQRLLAVDGFCQTAPLVGADGIQRCGKDDSGKLGAARDAIQFLLLDTTLYAVPQGISGAASLFTTSAPVQCRTTDGQFAKNAPVDRPAPFDQKTIPIRLRGSTDGLQFDRNLDSAFNGVDKASISFKDDDAAGKDTTKAAIVAGLVVPVLHNFQLVPYFGFETDTSKKRGEDKQITSNIIRAGTLFDFRTHGTGISHLFLLRPEFAANRKERSEYVTGTLTYQPIVNGWLNIARNIAPDDQKLFSIIPRFDMRLVGGHFTKLGDRPPEKSGDFVRVGGQIGLTVTSDVKWLPLELTVTETYLHALQGEPDDLSYLKGVFSLYFDEKKYFGIDLGYARGRFDDLKDRDQNWTIGFGAKF